MTTTKTTENIAANFLNLCAPRRLDRAAEMLETLLAARAGDAEIFNVEYKDTKDFLGRVVEESYAAKVRVPFLAGRGFGTPESDLDYYLGSPSNLHDVVARAKKLARLAPDSKLAATVDPEMLRAVREVLDAALPVALLVKELKSSIVKGRRPTAPSEATIAARAKASAKKTCPCCFRAMTVTPSIVRHGWEEQGGRRVGSYGNAWHSGACFGVGYEPFEVSCRGTKDFRAALLVTLASMERGLATLEARPATLWGSYTKGHGRKAEKVSFTLEDDGGSLENLTWRDERGRYSNPTGSYAWNLRRYIVGAKRDLEALRGDLDLLAKAIADWKPGA